MAAVRCRRIPASAAAADASAARSSSVPPRVFGSPATIIRSDAPTADASAAADPPPGVGSVELKASRRSRTDLSASSITHDLPLLDHRADRRGAGADQIDRRTVHDHGIHLLARFEAAE